LGIEAVVAPGVLDRLKVTPRTQRQVSAWRTISAISSSLTPFFSVTTRVVEMLLRSSASSACWRIDGQVGAAQLHQGVALQAVELQIDLEARHVGRQPSAKPARARSAGLWC
jgi:hypothetical protein